MREAVAEFGEEERRATTLRELSEIEHKIAMKGEVSRRTLERIESVMASCPSIAASEGAKGKVIERALAKLAPFHRSRNSVGDGLLIEILVEAAEAGTEGEAEYFFLLIHEAQQGCRDATYEPSRFPVAVPYLSPHRATPAYVVVTSSDLDTSRNKASVSGLSWISRYFFVTHNTRDFSQQDGDQPVPHADLQPVFASGKCHYAISIVDVVKRINGEMLAEYEWNRTYDAEPRRLSEIIDAEHLLFRQVWYNRHMNLRFQVESDDVRIITSEDLKKLDGYHPEVVVDAVWQRALKAARKTEDEVGRERLGPWDDFEWGMINGKLSAIRWMLGDEWDMLDT